MKPLPTVGVLVIVAACLLAPAGAMGAHPCPAGCGLQKKACLQTARVGKLVCKLDCRASAGPATLGACLRGCTEQFGTAKTACAGDHAACLGFCPPAPLPGSCTGAFLDGCGQNLAACARGVVAQAKTCVQGCLTASDRLACLQGCAATAQQGAATSAANFETCVAACSCPTGCDDGNPCTRDTCLNGKCAHECLCVGPTGDVTCCPGPGPCPAPTTTTTLPTGGCTTDVDCDDGNPCTADRCVNGICEHACLCVDATGSLSCCPGPAALCVRPCGLDASGVCGGACAASNEVCIASGATCTCTPIPPACGDTFPACNGSCPAGSSCTSLTGAPVCQCVPTPCRPGSGTYFYTCGDPVCGGHQSPPGVPACTTEQVGDPCACLGAECDPGDACDRLLECATSDPTHGEMCPISRRRYKTNIQYLSAQDVKRLHDALLTFRLASYQYNLPGTPADPHLGFIIDDVAPSPSVAPNGDTVDLYGYASMAVAAVQEQAREIDQLTRQVASLRQELKEIRLGRPRRHARHQ